VGPDQRSPHCPEIAKIVPAIRVIAIFLHRACPQIRIYQLTVSPKTQPKPASDKLPDFFRHFALHRRIA
tara:strand:+ start:261 stop:467 length:207 start_codon:yes stop_codon:yes gene_type:complete